MMRDLAVSENTTYLDIKSHFVTDLSDNPADAVMDGNVGVYINDSTSPRVISFTLSMNGKIVIGLDEIVDGQTFRPEYIIIEGIDNSTGYEGDVYVLQSSSVMPVDTRRLEIILSDEDLNGFKANQRIATSHRTTYLAINGYAVMDITGNPIELISLEQARIVDTYIADTVNPNLVSFNLNMNDGILMLNFSEAVDVDTLKVNEFVLQSNMNGVSALTYRLSDVSISQSNDRILSINILQSDVFMLQLIDGLATDEFNT